jgi:hypothetical protein
MSRTIPEHALNGIEEALKIHAPQSLPKFYSIKQSGHLEDPFASPSWIRGATEGGLTATVSWKDGEPILRALEDINREHNGEVLRFNKLTIDGLINAWRQFVVETPPTSPLPQSHKHE